MVGIRWKDWKTMPIVSRRKAASASSLWPFRCGSGDGDVAGTDALEAGDHHEKRGLAGTRRADNADRIAGLDAQIGAAQDFDGAGTARQGETDIFERDQGIGMGWVDGAETRACRRCA